MTITVEQGKLKILHDTGIVSFYTVEDLQREIEKYNRRIQFAEESNNELQNFIQSILER